MTIEVKRVGKEKCEEAFNIFHCAQQKLISEGKSEMFGGMTPKGVKRSAEEGFLYLGYRKGDELPVVAISILEEEDYTNYSEVLEVVPASAKVATLNAIAARPEFWGRGYARQALKLVVEMLKQNGFTTIVGTVHPENRASLSALRYVSNNVKTGVVYEWTTPRGRTLRRKKFVFLI